MGSDISVRRLLWEIKRLRVVEARAGDVLGECRPHYAILDPRIRPAVIAMCVSTHRLAQLGSASYLPKIRKLKWVIGELQSHHHYSNLR